MKRKAFMIILLLIFSVNAFAFMSSPATKEQPLTTALHKTGIKIIDIRTEGEWKQTGIVKGSYPITFFDEKGHYDSDDFLRKLNKVINKTENFAIICRSGNRTTSVAKFLRKEGYLHVLNLKGGIKQAIANGVELERYSK